MKRHIAVILVFIFLFFLIFSTYKDYGIPWDEKVFFNTGKYFIVKVFNFLNIQTNLSTGGFEPTPYHLRGHGVFMDMLTVFAGLPFRNFNFETLHLIRALFALPIFFLLYWIVSKSLSKVYGLISIVFLLLFPRFYPEIYYNAVDIATALLFTICLAYFIYYSSSEIEKQKQDSSRQARTIKSILKSILFGFILGITINQRLLLYYLPIVNFIFLFFVQRKNLKHFVIQQLTIFLSTIFFLHLTHPYLFTHPITGLFEIISHSKQYPWNASVLFEGKFFSNLTFPLPWYYLPKTMVITTPLITLALFLTGNFAMLFNLLKTWIVKKPNPTSGVENAFIRLYLLIIFYLPIVLTLFLKPTLYDSWRQFLFLTIPTIIIAMFGLEWIWSIGHSGEHKRLQNRIFEQRFQTSWNDIIFFFLSLVNWKLIRNSKLEIRNLLRLTILAIILINLLQTAKEMIILHPYEYIYYNSVVGGSKGASINYETDYWGLSYKEAAIWFNNYLNNPTRQYKIYVEGDPLSSLYYLKPNVKLVTDPNEADYVFTFTRWDFDKRHLGKTVHVIAREDVPLIYIKQGGALIEELKTRPYPK